ncbi:MAG: type III-A CRISPR-associated RAMP protein Csm3 [Candidatus Heimdallarchaeaceae archaeon]
MENYQLKENVIIRGQMELKTGMHIGGLKDSPQIGGIDMPVITDPVTGLPYIPGSSLKGRMRALIEYARGKIDYNNDGSGSPHASQKECKDENCEICVVFGSSKGENTGTTRLIVRDAFLTEGQEDLELEVKIENVINRVKGSALSPRTIERVPAGTVFEFELVYSIYDTNNDRKHLDVVLEALQLIEDTYLGGSGTRGYGKVKFNVTEIRQKTIDDYKKGEEGKAIIETEKGMSLSEVRKNEEYKHLVSA